MDRNGWIVCVASIFITFNNRGMANGFGVFIAEFSKLYATPIVELDWMAVLVITLGNILSPVAYLIRGGRKNYAVWSVMGTLFQSYSLFISSMVDNLRWLFLTYSVLFGFSSALILNSSSLIISDFFPVDHKRHILATTLYQCGYPLGALIYTPLLAWVVDKGGWTFTLRVFALVVLINGIICSLLFLLKRPRDNVESSLEITNFKDVGNNIARIKSTLLDVFKKPERICWLIGVLLICSSQLMPMISLPHFMESNGFGKVESSLVVTVYGVFELAAYLILAAFGGLLKGSLIFVPTTSCLIFGIVLLIWPQIEVTYANTMAIAAVLGILTSSTFAFLYPASGEAMDMNIEIAWTISSFFCGLGVMLGPLFFGAVYDIRHSYNDSFYVSGAVCLVNAIVLSAIPVIMLWRNRQQPYDISS